MPKTEIMAIGIPGVEVWINYQQSNKRIQSVQWTIPQSGVVVRARVWDSDVSEDEKVYDKTEGGPSAGAQTIPGNNRMIEVVDSDGTFYDLPSNITYQFSVQTI